MIDLHVHSTASDGTFSPEEIAARGRDFALMALTDHDSTDGVARFLAESRRLGVTAPRLTGVELGVEPGAGYDKFHLLGLGFDLENEPLQDLMREIRAIRDGRNRLIFEKLADLGVPVTEEDVRKHVVGTVIGKPHFAHALEDRGWVANRQEAFAKFLGNGCPADIPHAYVAPELAIERIHAAGGLAIMAHPFQWTRDRALLRNGLIRLKDVGLDGIEAHYHDFSPAERQELAALAHDLHLLITAGSDFHGGNKPTIPLGMEVEDEKEFVRVTTAIMVAGVSPQWGSSGAFLDFKCDTPAGS